MRYITHTNCSLAVIFLQHALFASRVNPVTSKNPKRRFAVEVIERLTSNGYTALLAGGCVRDLVLGRQPEDYDVATNATPDEVRQLFGHRKTLGVGESFGVIIVRGPKQAGQVEVATFRTEGAYSDGRHPDHVAFSTPQEDARRRDFTINGMFYDPLKEQVLDYVGGEQDLRDGVVRAIGNPSERMSEDKLRMLRAVRFTAKFEFDLHHGTATAIRDMADQIQVVSAERIAQELQKILVDRHRRRALELAHEIGLLEEILPELRTLTSIGEETIENPSDDQVTWKITLSMLDQLDDPSFGLAAVTLLCGIADTCDLRSICKRLKLSNQDTDHIDWLVSHRRDLVEGARLSLAKLKRTLAHPLSPELLMLMRVEQQGLKGDLSEFVFCEEFLRRTPLEELDPPAVLTGDDLIALGLQPGKLFKELLQAVRDAQLNGEVATKQEALEMVVRLMEESNN